MNDPYPGHESSPQRAAQRHEQAVGPRVAGARAADLPGPPRRHGADGSRGVGANAAGWARIGGACGYVGAVGLLVQSVLFALDSFNIVAPEQAPNPTDGDADQVVAGYFYAWFARQHDVWWNIAVRDSIGPLGLLAVVVAVATLISWLGRRDPAAALSVLLFSVGAVLSIISDLTYLSLVGYWRFDWSEATTTNMLASGRAAQAIDLTTTYPQDAGYLVIAAGLACLWWVSRTEPRIPRWARRLSLAQAATLPVFVITTFVGPQALNAAVVVLAGVVTGPLLAVAVARTFRAPSPEVLPDN